jgi:hypothetical protein
VEYTNSFPVKLDSELKRLVRQDQRIFSSMGVLEKENSGPIFVFRAGKIWKAQIYPFCIWQSGWDHVRHGIGTCGFSS